MNKIKKILFISSNQHFTDIFLKDLIKLISKNFHISLITNIKKNSDYYENLDIHNVPIKRKLSPFSDLFVLFIILKKIFEINPDRIISTNPKTIIFGIIIKIIKPKLFRIHIYTGFAWSNMSGFKKKFFIFLDKINVSFSDKVLFDSQSQIDLLGDYNFNKNNFNLINKGSIKGVDTKLFYKFDYELKKKLKIKYSIPDKYKILLYMGRMDEDKGIYELIESFKNLKSLNINILLLLVGEDEIKIESYLNQLQADIRSNIIYLKHTINPQEILNIADIFCLPSKREGFGNSVIESSACEIPVVGSDIFGLKNSLINELNGLTFKIGDVDDLTLKLHTLLRNETLRKSFGKNGRKYVIENFEKDDVLNSFKNLIIN